MKRVLLAALALSALVSIGTSDTVRAFCGFYVAKADATLFNEASQVVLVRDGKRTVITMVNDFKGEPSEFASFAQSIVENPMVNGCTLRLDGAIRMAAK